MNAVLKEQVYIIWNVLKMQIKKSQKANIFLF
jgi:hypothetical protein